MRELQNFIERSILLSEGNVIGEDIVRDFITDSITHNSPSGNVQPVNRVESQPDSALRPIKETPSQPEHVDKDPETISEWVSMDQVERAHICETLQHTYFNQSAAARLLKRNRQWLIRKVKQYGLDISKSQPGRPRTKR